MRILIVAKYFAPQNTIGAIRPTKIAKYLKRIYGCSIDVVTMKATNENVSDSIGEKDLQYVDKLIQIDDAWWVKLLTRVDMKLQKRNHDKNIKVTANTAKWKIPDVSMPLATKIIYSIKVILEWLKELTYTHNAMCKLKKGGMYYDLIFSTYGPPSSIMLAYKLRKKNPETFWIADFRDAVHSGQKALPVMKWKAKKIYDMVLKLADRITTVSSGVASDMNFDTDKRLTVIPNGYDKEDISDMEFAKSDIFTLAYTGMLYEGKQDLNPLFKVLENLIASGKIDSNKICFKYAGPHYDIIENLALKYNISSIVKNVGLVERKEALRIQLSSDVLVFLSWNIKNEATGLLGGKTLEYMMAEKPIIALVAGDEPNSLISNVIRDGNLGFCYEEASTQAMYSQLEEYVLKLYTEYCEHGENKCEANRKYTEQYSYAHIAPKLWELYAKGLE